jgi:V/A-type H+-transporting ATPase subunit I
MIVRMKELLLFVASSQTDEALHTLGTLGVVDIKAMQRPEGPSIDWCQEQLAATDKALTIMRNQPREQNGRVDQTKYRSGDPRRIVDTVLGAERYKNKCRERITKLEDQLAWYRRWGTNVRLKDLAYLRQKGVYAHLYQAEPADVADLPERPGLVHFPEVEGVVPVALFTKDETDTLPLREEQLPTVSATQVEKELRRKQRQLHEADVYLTDMAANIPLLEDYLADTREKLDFRTASAGMEHIEGKVSYLRGFLPSPTVDQLKTTAQEQSWGYLIREPETPDEVPVYVKNPRWISIINPVLRFVGVVPGYKEVDISLFFLIAFALFFAMLIGDAGYGALFLVLALLLRKRLTRELRILVYVLSGATIAWGVITGTYFGSEQIAALPFLKPLIIEEVSSFGVDNISFMMHLSFLIGAAHLSVAHAIRAVRFSNSIKVLSELGWIAMVWGLFLLVEMLVLGKDMPGWALWLFGGGFVLIALFSQEDRNFFKSIGLSLANLPLSLINGFSDVVSYVRLFAVGMATAVVAASFNEMILPAGVERSPWQLIVAAFALALGHGLNIILALMAVMVHGIRLNMLEFAGHLGMQFSGKAYNPFVLRGEHKDQLNTNEKK